MKRVGIWIRVSTMDQAESDSPMHHEMRGRAYAEARGWTVVEIYDLAGVSGKSVKEHPEAKRMLADVQRGHIQALIFSKLGRLARSTKELLEFSDWFGQHDADLISLQEAIDTSTPAGRLFYTVIAAMAQWEREEIAERVHASVMIRAKLGKPLGGKVVYGYHYHEGKVRPHPDEAPVRRLMYELFAVHKRKKVVARLLNERGHRTRKSKFTDTTVERLIRDTTAKGEHRTNYTFNDDQKRWRLKPEHEWIINPVVPIVPLELWQACNDILDQNRTSRVRIGRRPLYTFAGFVFCACGGKMASPSNTRKYTCPKCRRKILQDDLDHIFREELKVYLTTPDKLATYINQAGEDLTKKTELVRTLRRELAKVGRDIDECYKLYGEGASSPEQFRERHDPLHARKKELEAEIPRTEAEIARMKVDDLSQQEIMSQARKFYSFWPQMSPERKRQVVEKLVERIEVSDNEVDVTLCYMPSSENTPIKQRSDTGSWRRPT